MMHFLFVYAQTKKTKKLKPPPPEIELKENTQLTKYNTMKRTTFYPFNKSLVIKIVSFDKQISFEKGQKSIGSDRSHVSESSTEFYGLPIHNDTIVFAKISQEVLLTQKDKNTLSDILYNTCGRWTFTSKTSFGCYYPHNAIIFFDINGKAFEYIELCFDCHQLKYSNSKIEKFEDCDYMFSDLKSYFTSLGLRTSKEEFEKR